MVDYLHPSGFNSFIMPFVLGMTFVLVWCVAGAIRVIYELTPGDRKKFFLSLINPKIMAKNIKEWFCDCLSTSNYGRGTNSWDICTQASPSAGLC
jgi:hypothetical protein